MDVRVADWEAFWKPAIRQCPFLWGRCVPGLTEARSSCSAQLLLSHSMHVVSPPAKAGHGCVCMPFTLRAPPVTSRLPVKSRRGADNAWANVPNAPQSMEKMFISFASLGLISARFAARLAEAGALSALMRLATKQREHCGEVQAGCGAGAGAGGDAAQPEMAALKCFTDYARLIPQVSRQG